MPATYSFSSSSAPTQDQIDSYNKSLQAQATPIGGYTGSIGGSALEGLAGTDIANLLNPPSMFPDTNRQAAEIGAARGIPGSPAAFGTGLRLTADEQLKRIALGNQLLTSQADRSSTTGITPIQQAQLDLQKQRNDLEAQRVALEDQLQQFNLNQRRYPGVTYSGGGPGGGYSTRSTAAIGDPLSSHQPFWEAQQPYTGAISNTGAPGALGGGISFGGAQDSGFGNFDLDAALAELGLTGEGDMSMWDAGGDNQTFDPSYD